MISIDRLKEMTIEELQTELKNFEEQTKLQNNFIDSLLKATNNSEWLDKSMLDDEVGEVIEKIELDYVQLDQLKEELAISIQENEEGREINAELRAENKELKEKCKKYGEINEQETKDYAKLMAENEKLKIYKSITPLKVKKLVKTLNEIKPILELYANSNVGEEQPDGTYKLSSGIGGSFGFGFCTTTYDPRPARQALQKISEVK